MKILIEYKPADVFTEVEKASAYTGDRKAEDGAYERIAAMETDHELLERFLDEGEADFIQLVKGYFHAKTSSEDKVAISLNMPDNFDAALTSDICESLLSFLTNFILSRWYIIVNKDEAEIYIREADRIKSEIRYKLHSRKLPTRNHVTPENPEEPGTTTVSNIIVQKI